MRARALIIGIISIVIMVVVFTDAVRLAKTIWLIAQVTPYEQVGRQSADGKAVPHILVLGDSTGYGTGASDGRESVAGQLGTEYPHYQITNNSKNGRTIGEALEIIKALPQEKMYELLLLQIGGNDILQKRPITIVQRELTELHAEAKSRSNHVVMMSSGNVGAAAAFVGTSKAVAYESLSREFRGMFIEVAAASDVTYVDLFQEPQVDVFALEPKRLLAIDGLHPSSAGYRVWYQSLSPVVRKLLRPE